MVEKAIDISMVVAILGMVVIPVTALELGYRDWGVMASIGIGILGAINTARLFRVRSGKK